MKHGILSLLASAAVLAFPAAASAQGQGGLNERQAQLEQRIEAGVRSGQLDQREARRLRAEFDDIARMEAQYRDNGLSPSERAELERRMDGVSEQLRSERRGGQNGGYAGDRGAVWNVNERQAQLDRRIETGLRNGDLNQREARRLRAEFEQISRLEAQYRSNGLSPSERADLDRRFDGLSQQIRSERRDGQNAGNGGQRSGRWENLNQRQAMFEQRLDTAVRDRRITGQQANNLRVEFSSIATLEQRYRRDGLNPAERAELDARFDRLQANFRASVAASQYGNGYGQAPNLFDYLFGLR